VIQVTNNTTWLADHPTDIPKLKKNFKIMRSYSNHSVSSEVGKLNTTSMISYARNGEYLRDTFIKKKNSKQIRH